MRKTVTDLSLGFSVDFDLTPKALWSLLTENPHIAAWWGNHVAIEAAPDGSFRELWNNGDREVVTSGKIRDVDCPHSLSMTWADDDWPGSNLLELRISTGDSGGSRLELTHKCWEVHPLARRKSLMADHAAGWEYHLGNLASYAETSAKR